mgnify:CR=1 FL=1
MLIKVEKNQDGEQLVNARELWEFLESKQKFTDWIKRRILKYGFIENLDFTIHKFMTGKNLSYDYILKLDMAKELAMVENNEKGKMARRYFIEKEKEYIQLLKGDTQVPTTISELDWLNFTMDRLSLSDSGKITMLQKYGSKKGLPTDFLPDYVEEAPTYSLTHLLKKFNVKFSAMAFNKKLIELKIIEEVKRTSSKGKIKKYKKIIELKYGKNLINPQNLKETQAHYYMEPFLELVNLVMEVA